MGRFERRGFLAGLTAAPILASAARAGNLPARRDYMFDPALTYLNTGSLGPTPVSVFERTVGALRELEINPVRMGYGRQPDSTASAADQVRGKAAVLLGCDAEEVLITTGTTQGMTILAQSIVLNRGDRILTTDQEHAGGNVGWTHLHRRRGVAIDTIGIAPEEHDTAAILQRFVTAIHPTTRVISISHVITSTGLRMPIAEIAALARSRNVLCVVDGAQALGCIDVDVKALGCDAYAASGHKWLMGPKGTGLLYISRDAGAAIEPVQWEMEKRYNSDSMGVGPVALAIGLGAAIDLHRCQPVERRVQTLRDAAYRGFAEIGGLQMVGPPPGAPSSGLAACRLPPAFDSRAIVNRLRDHHGMVVKMIEKRWFNGIRMSPHIFNTDAEIDRCATALRTELTAL